MPSKEFAAKIAAHFVLTPGRAVIAWGWNKARKEHLAGRPHCYVCGHRSKFRNNDVHHILPRHVAPDLVGVSVNLVTLCRKNNCHLVFGHLGDYRRRYNPDILRVVGALGARMIAVRKAFDAIQAMSPEERLKSISTFSRRVQEICRNEMPALPALAPADDVAPDPSEVYQDLRALKQGRRMHTSRVKRLVDMKLISKRSEIGDTVFSLTKRGRRFMKKPTAANLE